MSMVITRSPLTQIEMNGAGTTKRRSARSSHEGPEQNESPEQRKQTDNTTIATKTRDGVANGNSSAGIGRGRKRKQEYPGDDDGFTFVRKTRKKQAESPPAPPVASAETASSSSTSLNKRARSKPKTDATATKGLEADVNSQQTAQQKARKRLPTTPERNVASKSARQDNQAHNVDGLGARASPHKPTHAKSHAVANGHSPGVAQARPKSAEKKLEGTSSGGRVEEERVMRIALPFADTPIIRKNKEMRKARHHKGSRRSSGSLRGRRASSLIDEGRGNEESCDDLPGGIAIGRPEPSVLEATILSITSRSKHGYVKQEGDDPIDLHQDKTTDNDSTLSAMPHPEVPTTELYKHLAADMMEPKRMKYLLGWCCQRALRPESDSANQSSGRSQEETEILQTARNIQEQLATDLASKDELSNWFIRDEQQPPIKRRKKTNPRNAANLAKAEELERELEKLIGERMAWDDLIKTSEQQAQIEESDEAKDGRVSPLHTELLDPQQRAIWEQLHAPDSAEPQQIDPEDIHSRLKSVLDGLEFSIDSFALGVHQLSTTANVADRLAEKTLGDAAETLERREVDSGKDGGRGAGIMESLRGLASVLNHRPNSRGPRRR